MKLVIPEGARVAYRRLQRNRQITLILLVLSCLASLVAFFGINYNFRASLSARRAHTCFLKSHWSIVQQSPVNGKSQQNSKNKANSERVIPIGGNYSLLIDDAENKYGCYFVEWVYILSFVITFFMIWFFAIFKTSENRFYRQKPTTSARLVPPTVFLGFVFSLVQGIAAVMYTVGFANWCMHGVTIDNVPSHCINLKTIALQLSDKSAIRSNIFSVAVLAAVSSIISSLLWVALVILLGLRFFQKLDFPETVQMPVQVFNPKAKIFPESSRHLLASATEAINGAHCLENGRRTEAPISSASSPLLTSRSDSRISAI